MKRSVLRETQKSKSKNWSVVGKLELIHLAVAVIIDRYDEKVYVIPCSASFSVALLLSSAAGLFQCDVAKAAINLYFIDGPQRKGGHSLCICTNLVLFLFRSSEAQLFFPS